MDRFHDRGRSGIVCGYVEHTTSIVAYGFSPHVIKLSQSVNGSGASMNDQLAARFEDAPYLFRRTDGIGQMLKQKTCIRTIELVRFQANIHDRTFDKSDALVGFVEQILFGLRE
jgi:hypothetical protein